MSERQDHLDASVSENSALSAARTMVDNPLERTRSWSDDAVAKIVLLLPGILVVLLLSVFPLIISLYLSVARVNFVKGGIQVVYVGLDNYAGLLLGNDRAHLLGSWGDIPWYGALAFAVFVALLLFMLYSYVRRPSRSISGLFFRLVAIVFASALAFLCIATLTGGETNIPGTLVVTLVFVGAGVFFEYILGLGLALLVTQELPGKRFFRVAFLLPMMITPVGIGFLFRMLTDTSKGPIAPIWNAMGLVNFTWASTGFGARTAVLVGDIWQWTPFMFIILLAALEAMSRDQIEAALVDGATRQQLFRYLIVPQILPVSITLVLIRTIEAFKIIDLPNILTGGGPGTATESLTFHAYNLWRTLELGQSAAVSYILLIVVTFVAIVYMNSIRRRLLERI
jgi:multiple sugar transport system permease protein